MIPTINYINDLDIIMEAIDNGDSRDAKQMLCEIQGELKGKHLIDIDLN